MFRKRVRSDLRRPVAVAVSAATVVGAIVAVMTLLTACSPRKPISTVDEVAFARPLTIPPLASSTVDDRGVRVFELTAQEGSMDFLPGDRTPTWGFSQDYLGPTIVASRSEQVEVDVKNDLEEITTVHWHGMRLPARMDGGPHQTIEPGATWSPSWHIDQPAATLWYHPHPHGRTEGQVTKGLAGMVIVRDDQESALPLPRSYGIDDIPVIVQDTSFDDDNRFGGQERAFTGGLGDTVLVNGTVGPYFDVTTRLVRLRVLNASAARVYNLGFSDKRAFDLVGTDGGLLAAPYRTSNIQLSPGERAEIIVTMSGSETAVLRSSPPDLGVENNTEGEIANGGRDSFDLLELRARANLDGDGISVPTVLSPLPELPAPTTTRTFVLDGVTINDQAMQMDRVNEVVVAGTTEEWIVRNRQNLPHSFHVHDVQFRVNSVDGVAPPPALAGWKDTIYLRPNTTYSLRMQFTDYTDSSAPYMYHCHLLWHEDRGMMGQFVVVREGESAATIEGGTHDH